MQKISFTFPNYRPEGKLPLKIIIDGFFYLEKISDRVLYSGGKNIRQKYLQMWMALQ